jgi:hypothetical protein
MATAGGVDPTTLEIGRRYRVDRKHEGLRRTFRSTGVLVAMDTVPSTEPGGPDSTRLTFELKPRFAKPVRQTFDVATLVAVVPV